VIDDCDCCTDAARTKKKLTCTNEKFVKDSLLILFNCRSQRIIFAFANEEIAKKILVIVYVNRACVSFSEFYRHTHRK